MPYAHKRSEAPYHHMLSIVSIGNAAHVLKRCILGDSTVTAQQERVSLEVFRKIVPSLQAIAIEARVDKPNRISDIQALLLSSGVSLEALDMPEEIEAPAEKNDPAHNAPATPRTPDVDE